ncbi:hypothetical protein QQS21_012323 [Conoideocrella luteorostrata]|uniref:DUF7924 domain-containing protein n=1 Tax=Conoideocrella luteorostrata TaxID=1105319 RepID=A0AAJ0CDR6_9HYPO|nr:hypothetical protein QQS21_012323 [Conoideocrella luteorostrata]
MSRETLCFLAKRHGYGITCFLARWLGTTVRPTWSDLFLETRRQRVIQRESSPVRGRSPKGKSVAQSPMDKDAARPPESSHVAQLLESSDVAQLPTSISAPPRPKSCFIARLSMSSDVDEEAVQIRFHLQRPRSRARTPETECAADGIPTERCPDRPHPPAPDHRYTQATLVHHEAFSTCLSANQIYYIGHWAQQGQSWPEAFFRGDTPRITSFRRKQPKRSRSLNSSLVESDPNQPPRNKRAPSCGSSGYGTVFQNHSGIYMDSSDVSITETSAALCAHLLETKFPPPKNTIFKDHAFTDACQKLQGKNKARIAQDIGRLLVPSAETVALLSDKRLSILVESVNEIWTSCIPVANGLPRPSYAVGFGQSAFSDEQLSVLEQYWNGLNNTSRFAATCCMYFPFLACEVESGDVGLDVTDSQNNATMVIAIKTILEVFKLANRETCLDGELLTFSISHDQRSVRLYGYYPVFREGRINIYRHPIHAFDITALDGKDRWTTYSFTLGVYYYSLALMQKIGCILDDVLDGLSPRDSQESEPETSASSSLARQQSVEQTPGD